MFAPYVYAGGGTWAPVIGVVERFERMAGKPPAYSFVSTSQLSLGSTVLLTISYSPSPGAIRLVPVDLGFITSVRHSVAGPICEYEVDSLLSLLYNAPVEVTERKFLSAVVGSIVAGIRSATGLSISYLPRGFEIDSVLEPGVAGRFSDLLSRELAGSVDYALHFGTLELTNLSAYAGSITPRLTAVKSSDPDGYWDTFTPVTILENSSDYEAVPVYAGSSGMLRRRLLKVVTKPTRVSAIVWVSPDNTTCLGKTYGEACVALNYKLQGGLEVWKITPTTPTHPGSTPSGYRLVSKLCCRGEVGSEKATGCDYSVDMRVNEEMDRLVLTFRDEIVGDGSYFLVVMDAVKVIYIEDDSPGHLQTEVVHLRNYRSAWLFPEYPSGSVLLLSRDGDYIRSHDPQLYLIARGIQHRGLLELAMVPGKPFFKRNTLRPEGTQVAGLLVNVVAEWGSASHLVSRVRLSEGRLIYELKPLEHHASYIEAIEELRRAVYRPV
jgi:hypothetical protein